MSSSAVTGSAERWGPLWGARPADWAMSEDQQAPTYAAALDASRAGVGAAVLDVGCGVGAFLRLVAERRRPRLVSMPRTRSWPSLASGSPGRSARRGDGGAALGEQHVRPRHRIQLVLLRRRHRRRASRGRPHHQARRPVMIQVWGPHERNELEAMKTFIRPFIPPRPRTPHRNPTTPRPAPSRRIATAAGLDPDHVRHHLVLRVRGRGHGPPRTDRTRRARRAGRPRPRGGGQGRYRERYRGSSRPRRDLSAPERLPLPDRPREMSHYAVIREAGPGWEEGGSPRSRMWPTTPPS